MANLIERVSLAVKIITLRCIPGNHSERLNFVSVGLIHPANLNCKYLVVVAILWGLSRSIRYSRSVSAREKLGPTYSRENRHVQGSVLQAIVERIVCGAGAYSRHTYIISLSDKQAFGDKIAEYLYYQ